MYGRQMNDDFFIIIWQGAVNEIIPIYKEAVKSNIVVKIDQDRFLPSDMWDDQMCIKSLNY